MKYDFSYYNQKDHDEIAELIINSYSWENPSFTLSQLEFSNGLHPKFVGLPDARERTVGVFRQNGKIAACAINESCDDGCAYFLFDSKKRACDTELLLMLVKFAKTSLSCVDEKNIKRTLFLKIPEWNITLKKLAEEKGFVRDDWQDRCLIRPFDKARYDVELPDGYTIADGNTTPAFYLANVHMTSFNYNIKSVPDGTAAFEDIRKQRFYDPDLDLCILDELKRPVAMAIIWYDKRMPVCELEPLGVSWWERRKGLATAILNEASNRVMGKYPDCQGMQGGDQVFYTKIGYKEKYSVPQYKWEADIYISWDERSKDKDYSLYI